MKSCWAHRMGCRNRRRRLGFAQALCAAAALACATTGSGGAPDDRRTSEPRDQAHSLWLMILGEQSQLDHSLDDLCHGGPATCAGVCAAVNGMADLARLLCDLSAPHGGEPELVSLCHDGRARWQDASRRSAAAGCPCLQ